MVGHDSGQVPQVVAIQMTASFSSPHLGRLRPLLACEPIRLRATITIDIEGRDYVDAQQAKSAIEAQFTAIRQHYETAGLAFKQRKPRARPRPGAPGPIISPYVDD